MNLAPASAAAAAAPTSPRPVSPEVELHEPAVLHNPVNAAPAGPAVLHNPFDAAPSEPAVLHNPFNAAPASPPPTTPASEPSEKPAGLKEQELLGELQTDEIWWHPKGLVKEDPTKPKKLIGLDQQLLKTVETCLNKKDLRYKDRMVEVMAAIEKINEQDVDPAVAEVADTVNWSHEEMQEEISRLRMLNALLNNNLAAWQLRGEHAEKDANNMAERLNNLLFHASRAR